MLFAPRHKLALHYSFLLRSPRPFLTSFRPPRQVRRGYITFLLLVLHSRDIRSGQLLGYWQMLSRIDLHTRTPSLLFLGSIFLFSFVLSSRCQRLYTYALQLYHSSFPPLSSLVSSPFFLFLLVRIPSAYYEECVCSEVSEIYTCGGLSVCVIYPAARLACFEHPNSALDQYLIIHAHLSFSHWQDVYIDDRLLSFACFVCCRCRRLCCCVFVFMVLF